MSLIKYITIKFGYEFGSKHASLYLSTSRSLFILQLKQNTVSLLQAQFILYCLIVYVTLLKTLLISNSLIKKKVNNYKMISIYNLYMPTALSRALMQFLHTLLSCTYVFMYVYIPYVEYVLCLVYIVLLWII